MNNIAVILKEQADKDAVKNLVESMGGHWRTSPTKPDFDEGVFQRGQAVVLLSYGSVNDYTSEYEPDELEFLKRFLGVEPNIKIDFAMRRNSASSELAREIAEKIIQLWGGFLHDCDKKIGDGE